MIFSRQQMETLTAYVTIFYDKALLLNFEYDSFTPLKVSEKEWDKVDKSMSFSEWIKGFVNSEYSRNAGDLLELTDMNKMKNVTSPMIFNYEKIVSGEFHDVQLELYPIGSSLAYLVVRDLTKMQNYIMEDY